MSDRTFPFLIGAGAAAAYFWYRSKKRTEVPPQPALSTTAPPVKTPTMTAQPPRPVPQLTGRWVWPVPKWSGRAPVISSGWGSPRPGGPHRGADIMFRRVPSDPYRPGTPNGSKLFVMPENHSAVAASDGVVWSAGWGPGGFAVVIDHGPRKVATYYNHLSELFVAPTSRAKSGQRVYAGQPLGIIGASPRDSENLKHLHFGVWLGGPKDAVDPAPIMRSWEYINEPPRPTLPPQTPPPTPVATAPEPTRVARNAGLSYRSVGDRTAPADALDEEARLSARLHPRDNVLGQPQDDTVPF